MISLNRKKSFRNASTARFAHALHHVNRHLMENNFFRAFRSIAPLEEGPPISFAKSFAATPEVFDSSGKARRRSRTRERRDKLRGRQVQQLVNSSEINHKATRLSKNKSRRELLLDERMENHHQHVIFSCDLHFYAFPYESSCSSCAHHHHQLLRGSKLTGISGRPDELISSKHKPKPSL